MYGQMGVALDFPMPTKILCTTSRITNPKSTGLSSDKAPKMMFPIVIVTQVGFFGYNMGTKNSRTHLVLTSLHSEIDSSFGLT